MFLFFKLMFLFAVSMEKLLFLIFENVKISRVQLQIDHCHLFLDGYLKLHPSVNMPKIFCGKCWGCEDYFLSRLFVIVVNLSGSFKKNKKPPRIQKCKYIMFMSAFLKVCFIFIIKKANNYRYNTFVFSLFLSSFFCT